MDVALHQLQYSDWYVTNHVYSLSGRGSSSRPGNTTSIGALSWRLEGQWCAPPTTRALVVHSCYTLPKYMFLDIPHDATHSVAWFRLFWHTLIRQPFGITGLPLSCNHCEAHNNIQDEQHAIFHSILDVSTFGNQNSNRFFLHEAGQQSHLGLTNNSLKVIILLLDLMQSSRAESKMFTRPILCCGVRHNSVPLFLIKLFLEVQHATTDN